MFHLGKFVDYDDPRSIGSRLRQRRFARFLELFPEVLQRNGLRILDVGGTPQFWNTLAPMGNHHITLINLLPFEVTAANMTSLMGDACHMPQFADRSFDIVFSNSVLEHVGSHERQAKMAGEIRRIGKRYWVQTPNYGFPIEPHFLFPFVHWLPRSVTARLLTMTSLGRYKREPNLSLAIEKVNSISLLKKRQLEALFPGDRIDTEKILGLGKSFVAVR